MEVNSGFILGTFVAILLAFVFYKFFRRNKKQEGPDHSQVLPSGQPEKLEQSLAPVDKKEEKKESALDYIRARQQSGVDPKRIFVELIRDKDRIVSHFETEDILSALKSLGYSVRSLVSWFNEAGYALEDLTTVLADYLESLSNKEFLEVLFPLVKGETVGKRIENFLETFGQTWDYGENDFADFAEALLEQDCTLEDVVGALYRKADMLLGEIIEILPAGQKPDLKTSARLARSLKVDLSDEHETLFDGKDLAEIVDFLREYGMNAEEAMQYISERESPEVGDVLDCFLKSYPQPQEVLSALLRSEEIEGSAADIVAAALERGISAPEIAECLKKENVDLEELDGGMRDADVGIENRILILHTIISSKKRNENSV